MIFSKFPGKLSPRKLSFRIFIFFSVIYSIQVLSNISGNSLTNDEPSDITNGYYYLTQGDVVASYDHPPLAAALNALPLLFLHLKTQPFQGDFLDRSHLFMFQWNLDHLSAITYSSRGISWLLGLGVGILLFRLSRARLALLFFTLFFWALNPTFLSLSGLAKTDIAPAFFFFLAVWAFQTAREKSHWIFSITAGVCLALAVTAKFHTLILIPLFIILEIASGWKDRWISFSVKRQREEGLIRWGWGLAGFTLWILLTYLPASLLLPDHQEPLSYLAGELQRAWIYAQGAHPVYFLGNCSLENHWYYLPVAFCLKEPLSFLLLLIFAGGLLLFQKIKIPLWQWLTPLGFFLAALFTPNLGVRYLLPLYPFLFLIAARGAEWLWEKRPRKSLFVWALGLLIFTQFFSVAAQYPNTLSYFNEIVPKNRKIYFLADSNLDWGQDLKRLARTARERNWGKVKLAYFGGVNPQIYGLDWEPFQMADIERPQSGTTYLVNASFIQLAPVAYPSTKSLAQGWLSQVPATGQVADSWYYFEIPGKQDDLKPGSWLASVPFLQYRGYVPYPPLPVR